MQIVINGCWVIGSWSNGKVVKCRPCMLSVRRSTWESPPTTPQEDVDAFNKKMSKNPNYYLEKLILQQDIMRSIFSRNALQEWFKKSLYE